MSDFINPYNFIPLVKSGKTIVKNEEEETFTGFIKYSLLTKTPLFIPNTSNSDAFKMNVEDHKSYDFFSYRDLSEVRHSVESQPSVPVIPGSEMRGMMRSNYEILTNSCMSFVDETAISKRTNQTFWPGLIKKDGEKYWLYRAEDCIYREGEKDNWKKAYLTSEFIEGERVYVVKKKRSRGKAVVEKLSREKITDEEGYVIKGEESPGGRNEKHCLHVMCKTDDLVSENISVHVLESVLRAYSLNNPNAYKEYTEQFSEFKQGKAEAEYFPVYYSFIDKKCFDDTYIMLSPACITRELYKNTIYDMIGTHKKCDDINNLCSACALFGILEKGFMKTSKVRFSDLTCTSDLPINELYHKPVTLAPLSSPKLNNMEFYYKRPDEDAWFWTADYWIDKNGRIHSYTPVINGRKFYWHQLNMKLTKVQPIEPTNLNTTIRPLKKNVSFEGKVFFENITKRQLDELIYLFNAGDDKKIALKEHGYKLGAAKPLGYGSVAVNVDQVVLRKVEKNDELRTIEFKESAYLEYVEPIVGGSNQNNEEIKHNFLKMTGFKTAEVGREICYPKTNDSEEIFTWFGNNHAGYRRIDNIKKPIKMPNSREQMVYVEYMQAMSPELKSTGFTEDTHSKESFDNKKNRKSDHSQRGISKDKLRGKIKMFNKEKNFGFISTENGNDYFVHGSNIYNLENMVVGSEVEFEVRMNHKKQKEEANKVVVK